MEVNRRMAPLISVIIPVYNTKKTALMRTLGGVASQSFTSIEIILVDDKSEVAFSGLDIKDLYPHLQIKLLINTVNQGVAKSRNIGIAESTAEYIAFLDAGDWWEPDKLERQYDKLSKQNQYCAVYTGAVFHQKNKTTKQHSLLEGNLFKALLVKQLITGSASSMMVRKKALNDVGVFHEACDIPEDRELWLRLARKFPITFIGDHLTHIEVIASSRSMNIEKKKQTYKKLLEMYESDLNRYKIKSQAYAHYYIVIAKKYYAISRYTCAFIYISKAFLHAPAFVIKGAVKQVRK